MKDKTGNWKTGGPCLPHIAHKYTNLRHEESKENLTADLGRNVLNFLPSYIEKYVNVKSTSIKFLCVLQTEPTRANLVDVQRGSVNEYFKEINLKSGWASSF